MAEGIQHALMGDDAVGDGEFIQERGKLVGHGAFPTFVFLRGQQSGNEGDWEAPHPNYSAF
jgi:hypothetical protein